MPLVFASLCRGVAGRALTIRAYLLRSPVLRAVVGLVIGFVAAAITFLAVDRYGTHDTEADTVIVHDDLDHDGYCATVRENGRAIRVADDAAGWRCGGFVDGMWSPTELDFEGLCRWQYGETAVPQSNAPDDAFAMACVLPNA
ncbi:MAG: hypothetical protein CL424_06575 [Acidimicrobiaceae bacterium]|nr:hypothetical protein [Acidimicrobiaceae bacterium]